MLNARLTSVSKHYDYLGPLVRHAFSPSTSKENRKLVYIYRIQKYYLLFLFYLFWRSDLNVSFKSWLKTAELVGFPRSHRENLVRNWRKHVASTLCSFIYLNPKSIYKKSYWGEKNSYQCWKKKANPLPCSDSQNRQSRIAATKHSNEC